MANKRERILKSLKEDVIPEMEDQEMYGTYVALMLLFAYNNLKIDNPDFSLDEKGLNDLLVDGVVTSPDCDLKDVEEAVGTYRMFNRMLETIDEPLTEELIKSFHYELKCGVYFDKIKGYKVGEYKDKVNNVVRMRNTGGVGMKRFATTKPANVPQEMADLLSWYFSLENKTANLVEFHAKFETIHPFQEGNGKVGRLILFREFIRGDNIPVLIDCNQEEVYYKALAEYRTAQMLEPLGNLFTDSQQFFVSNYETLL